MAAKNREMEIMRAATAAQSSSNRYLVERDEARKELAVLNEQFGGVVEASSMYLRWYNSKVREVEALGAALREANELLSVNGIPQINLPDDLPF